MQPIRFQFVWIALGLSGLLFFILLGLRLDVFSENTASTPLKQGKLRQKESWMAIYQKDRKIGYSHRRTSPLANGWLLSETTQMQLNTMGLTQAVNISSKGTLKPDFTLDSFIYELKSSLFTFKVAGKIEGNRLMVTIGEQKLEIPADKNLYLFSALYDAVSFSQLRPGQSRNFFIFDPTIMAQRPVKITMIGEEMVEVMGRMQSARKLSVSFVGISQTAWIDDDGNIVQEDGLMGIRIKKAARETALSGITEVTSEDLTQAVSVPANVDILQKETLKRLRLTISGVGDHLFLDGGRQHFTKETLTIIKENLADLPAVIPQDENEYLKPTPFIQSNHAAIREQVDAIISEDDTKLEKIRKMMAWISANIEKRPVISIPNAYDTLKNRMGDCNEHAALFAAMARAAGIPARIEAGLVYLDGRFYYHAWNVLYLGRWISADALMHQLPADVTHIRLVRGDPSQQINLVSVIGKIKLTILSQKR